MPGCRIDPDLCPQFNRLRNFYKKRGYPTIDDDLAEAFKNISKEVQANRCRLVGGFADILKHYRLLKYRQKNSGAREGARGGWRIYALHDAAAAILYPIIVYPKKELADASEKEIAEAIKEVLGILEKTLFNSG